MRWASVEGRLPLGRHLQQNVGHGPNEHVRKLFVSSGESAVRLDPPHASSEHEVSSWLRQSRAARSAPSLYSCDGAGDSAPMCRGMSPGRGARKSSPPVEPRCASGRRSLPACRRVIAEQGVVKAPLWRETSLSKPVDRCRCSWQPNRSSDEAIPAAGRRLSGRAGAGAAAARRWCSG